MVSSCVLKGGGGIFRFESFQTQAKIARLYSAFNMELDPFTTIKVSTHLGRLSTLFSTIKKWLQHTRPTEVVAEVVAEIVADCRSGQVSLDRKSVV